MAQDPDQRLADVVAQEQSRLRRFIRRRVPNAQDVEDILQDVFAELVEANRRLMPIDHVTGWLFRVARNRIIDLFRRKAAGAIRRRGIVIDDGELLRMEDLLPSADAGPGAVYAQQVLVEELERALGELPEEQRRVFVGHEIEGTELQADGRRDGRERQHAALAQALRRAPSARTAAARVRRADARGARER